MSEKKEKSNRRHILRSIIQRLEELGGQKEVPPVDSQLAESQAVGGAALTKQDEEPRERTERTEND